MRSMLAHAVLLASSVVILANPSQRAGATQTSDAPPPRKRTPVSEYPTETSYPKEVPSKVAHYLAAAREVAGTDLFPDFVHRCITDQRFRPRVNSLQFDGLLDPSRVFDQLYFVGQNAVSAWALDTRDGIILFDALNSAEEARDIIVPGLRRLNLARLGCATS